jgi:aspartyl protease family protein
MPADLPRSLKITTLWLLLGLLVFLGVQWYLAREQQTRFEVRGDTVELRRGRDGHYHWPGQVNGRAVDFLVDTGASGTTISATLARELGLQAIGSVDSQTAGGPVTGQVVRADLTLRGGVSVQRLRMVALPDLGGPPLLGMDVLGRLRWQQGDGVLRVQLDATR